MKYRVLLFLLIPSLITISCGSSRRFQANFTEDRPLYDAINALNRKKPSEKAAEDLKILYPKAVQRHEEAVEVYRNSNDENKWDRALNELNALQHIYTSLEATPGSFSIVKPKSYLKEIDQLRNEAAEDFYARGLGLMNDRRRESYLEAYHNFTRAAYFMSGYKDVVKLTKDAYESSIVNVVVNPIEDDNIFFTGVNGNWNSAPDYRYRPQDYQDQLVRELGGRTANNVPARFFNDRDVRRERVMVDWEINIRWRSLNPARSTPQQFSRQVSKSVESGKDSTGKPIYKTVYATLYITQNNFAIQGEVEYQINDLAARTSIDNGSVRDEVNYSESFATYTGDSRALSQDDWVLVNNRNGAGIGPSKGELLNNLMRKIYPELKRRIQNGIH